MPERDWSLPPLRESARVASAELLATREIAATPRGDARPGVAVGTTTLGGVECATCTPDSPGATVLYFHGGGYRMGAPAAWVGFTSAIAGEGGARVVAADYRLAPEYPFPAAVHDAVAAYDALLDAGTGGPIVVGGDSAGGGLAVALAVACRAAGVEPPSAVFALSPWVDLTIVAGTFTSNADTDQFFPLAAAHEAADVYLQGHDPRHPLASPLLADLAGFPPALLLVGGAETLLDDTLTLGAALAHAGASVETHVAAGMQHVWPMLFPELPESSAAVAAIGRFVRRAAQ